MGGMTGAYLEQAVRVFTSSMRCFLDGRRDDMINRIEGAVG